MVKTSPNGFAAVVPEVDASGQTAAEFMDTAFEFEYCGECGKDSDEHTAVIGPTGHWFAFCDRPENGQPIV